MKTMGNKNAYALKQIENRKLWMDVQRIFTMQYCGDLMAIMLHREFGFGAERCNRALEEFSKLHDEFYIEAIMDDAVDRDLNFTKGNIDNLLREIFKEDVLPWEERYFFLKDIRKAAKKRGVKCGR